MYMATFTSMLRNAGDKFWKSKAGEALGKAQTYVEGDMQNLPKWQGLTNALQGQQNPILRAVLGIPAGMAESIVNTPANYLGGIAKTGSQLGYGLTGREGYSPQQLVSGGSQLAESLLNAWLLSGGAKAATEPMRRTLGQAVGQGAMRGAQYGSMYGGLSGLQAGEQAPTVGQQVSGAIPRALAGAAAGGVLGGTVGGLGYGASRLRKGQPIIPSAEKAKLGLSVQSTRPDVTKYVNNEAIDAINAGRDIPSKVDGGDFKLKYVSTDAWRGYYDAIPTKKSGWKKISSDWVTGDWEDAGEHAGSVQEAKIADLASKIEALGGELRVIFAPTSNVFSTGMDVFVRGLKESQLAQFLNK